MTDREQLFELCAKERFEILNLDLSDFAGGKDAYMKVVEMIEATYDEWYSDRVSDDNEDGLTKTEQEQLNSDSGAFCEWVIDGLEDARDVAETEASLMPGRV